MGIVVVGAGPAGATLALLLAQRGVEVTLVERERDFARVFRGEGLMPGGIDALFAMGLGELLKRLPGRVLECWDIYIDGQPIFSVPEPIEKLGERAVRIISQPAFLEAVVAEAEKQPSFRLLRGATARELVERDGRVAGLRIQTESGSKELPAELVIGCDGRASVVRKRAGLELHLLDEQYDVLWFKLPAPEELRGRCRFLMLASVVRQAACYTSWDGRLQFALALPKGGFRELRDADWAEVLAQPSPPWLAEHIRKHRDQIQKPIPLDVIVGRAHQWSRPGVLLLGDAAHPMSPIRAQGINAALRDAVAAANQLVPVLSAGAGEPALDVAARAVQREREPEIVRTQTLQHRDAAGWNRSYTPALVFLGKHLGKLMGRYAWAQRAWLAQQHDLRFGTSEVRLEV